MDLSPSLLDSIADARAKVRVGFRWWLRPFLQRDVIAITLGRTIHVSEATSARPRERIEALLRHELAHVRQINRHGLLGFYARYLAEFARHLWRVRSINRAYAMISFEIEALAAEKDASRTSL
ncbi:MAG TPA: DUF4157 domain-containing protein [Thermoanaerobaculia bacterium]|nr:DUF4157 domain-containing protein [Thermoanaerobaculia bacterium]